MGGGKDDKVQPIQQEVPSRTLLLWGTAWREKCQCDNAPAAIRMQTVMKFGGSFAAATFVGQSWRTWQGAMTNHVRTMARAQQHASQSHTLRVAVDP